MTKKHFEAIAAILAGRARLFESDEARDILAEELADLFATTNPNFDRSRFLRACRGETNDRCAHCGRQLGVSLGQALCAACRGE